MPRNMAKSRLLIDSRKAMLGSAEDDAVADRQVLAQLLDQPQRLVLGVARGDVGEDGDGPLAVAAGDGLERRLLLEGDERGERDEVAVARPDAQPARCPRAASAARPGA